MGAIDDVKTQITTQIVSNGSGKITAGVIASILLAIVTLFSSVVFSGGASLSTSGGTVALTSAQLSAPNIKITGALSSSATVTVPAGTWGIINVLNVTSGAYLVSFGVVGQAIPIAIPQGQLRTFLVDGVSAYSPLSQALNLSTPTTTVTGDVACWGDIFGASLVDCGVGPGTGGGGGGAWTSVSSLGNTSLFGSVTGTGSFSIQVPDGTVAGGNARGNGSTDFQVLRFTAGQVASGNGAFLGGNSSTASGDTSFVHAYNSLGGNSGSVALGRQNLYARGIGSSARGQYVDDFSRTFADCWANNKFSADGDQQSCRTLFNAVTSSTTATRLTADGAAAGLHNCFNIYDNTAYRLKISGVGYDTTTATDYERDGDIVILKRGAGVGTTTLVSRATGTSYGTGVTYALAADTTNGCLSLTVTAANANATHWAFMIESVEIK